MRRTLFLLVALSLAVAGPTLAQKATSPEKTEKEKPAENAATVSGTVVSISDSELVLKTTDGDRRFSVDDSTEVPPDLGPNAHVKVTFQKMDDGLHAKRVAEDR